MEIDFLFEQDQTLYPVEVKRNATPKCAWTRAFTILANLKIPVGKGGVVCLCDEPVPLDAKTTAIPCGLL